LCKVLAARSPAIDTSFLEQRHGSFVCVVSLVGVMLFAYYRAPSSAFGKADRIYPTFIVTHMPRGIAGLLIAAILAAAMSNLSAALNSLSSSSMMDLYLRFRPDLDERRRLRLARLATVAWAAVLFALALIALHRVGRVIEVGLQIASVAYGALLGVFLLGVLTKRAHQNGAIIGMICGFGIELYLWLGTHVPWTWWVAIGTSVTFGVGYPGVESHRKALTAATFAVKTFANTHNAPTQRPELARDLSLPTER
jgi:Na+/proline symporter